MPFAFETYRSLHVRFCSIRRNASLWKNEQSTLNESKADLIVCLACLGENESTLLLFDGQRRRS